jgi:hypothetical protein
MRDSHGLSANPALMRNFAILKSTRSYMYMQHAGCEASHVGVMEITKICIRLGKD